MSSITSQDAHNGKREFRNENAGDIEHQARDHTLITELPKSIGSGVSEMLLRDSIMMISLFNSPAVCAGIGRIRYYIDHALYEPDGMERCHYGQCLCRQLFLYLCVWSGGDGAMGAFCRKRFFVHGF